MRREEKEKCNKHIALYPATQCNKTVFPAEITLHSGLILSRSHTNTNTRTCTHTHTDGLLLFPYCSVTQIHTSVSETAPHFFIFHSVLVTSPVHSSSPCSCPSDVHADVMTEIKCVLNDTKTLAPRSLVIVAFLTYSLILVH